MEENKEFKPADKTTYYLGNYGKITGDFRQETKQESPLRCSVNFNANLDKEQHDKFLTFINWFIKDQQLKEKK